VIESNTVQVTPFLRVSDLNGSLSFYKSILGFSCPLRQGDYAYVSRERAAIRLLVAENPEQLHEPQIVYIDVHDIAVVLEQIHQSINSLPDGRWKGPIDQLWDMRELIVYDPDGHIITFGQGIGSNANQWRQHDPR